MKVEVEIDETQFGLLCKPDEVQKLFTALDAVYGSLWCEACYDATNDSTQKLAERLLPHMQIANKILRFKK
jgi:hypothetical protein